MKTQSWVGESIEDGEGQVQRATALTGWESEEVRADHAVGGSVVYIGRRRRKIPPFGNPV